MVNMSKSTVIEVKVFLITDAKVQHFTCGFQIP